MRSKEYFYEFRENVQKFHKFVWSGNIPFVYIGKEEIHKYGCLHGRIANQRKVPKWLQFQNYTSESLIFDVHILGTCVHICTKYEVSTANHVARRTVHRQRQCRC